MDWKQEHVKPMVLGVIQVQHAKTQVNIDYKKCFIVEQIFRFSRTERFIYFTNG